MGKYEYNTKKFPKNSLYIIEDMINVLNVDKDFLDIITRINEKGNPVFSYHELYEIKEGIELNIPLKDIEKYIINSKDSSVYNASQLQEIFSGLETFATDTVDIYAKLNKNGNAIFDDRQMRALRMALEDTDILIEEVYELAKLDANMIPIYDGDQIEELYLTTNKIPFKEVMSSIGILNKD